MRRMAALLALAALLAGAGSAGAAPRSGALVPAALGSALAAYVKTDRWIARSLGIAARTWPNACAPVHVVTDYVQGPGGAWADLDGSCTIHLMAGWRGWFRWQVCQAVVQEVGHLANGPAHSSDPASVMYWTQVGPLPVCVKAPEWTRA